MTTRTESFETTINFINNTLSEIEWEIKLLADPQKYIDECPLIPECLSALVKVLDRPSAEEEQAILFEKVAVSIFYIMALIFGLLGNLLVILTAALGRKSRSLTGVDVINPCLLSLAAADLLIILFVIPIRVC